MLTTDPTKLHTSRRGETDDEKAMPLYDVQRAAFLKSLKEIPVIRMLVSGACPVTKATSGFVANRRGGTISHDLQVIIDVNALKSSELWGCRRVDRLLKAKAA